MENIVVVHHTYCGATSFTPEALTDALSPGQHCHCGLSHVNIYGYLFNIDNDDLTLVVKRLNTAPTAPAGNPHGIAQSKPLSSVTRASGLRGEPSFNLHARGPASFRPRRAEQRKAEFHVRAGEDRRFQPVLAGATGAKRDEQPIGGD